MGIRYLEKQFIDCECKTVTFASNTFPARKSIKFLTKLIKIKSSMLEGLQVDESKKTDKKENQKISLENIDIPKLIKSIGQNIDNDDIYNIVIEMLSFGKINEKELSNVISFDDAFSGDIPLMLEVVAFILYENYNNLFKKKFFSNLKNIIKI